MPEYVRIPEAEFEVMQIIWSQPVPISSVQVTGLQQKWKHQTVLTLLTRLTRRGYLNSEKQGKDRFYMPVVSREEYLNLETGYFMQKFHQNSLLGLMTALYSDTSPNREEIAELERWLRDQKHNDDGVYERHDH